MRRRRDWQGRYARTRRYLDEVSRLDAREVRAAVALLSRSVRVVQPGVDARVHLRWRAQPRGARGGGGGWVLTLECPRCLDSRRTLYLPRVHGAVVVGCRACLGLAYRSTARDRAERLRLRLERTREESLRPGAWSSTRLRALEAYREADAAYLHVILTTGPRWWRRMLLTG